MGMNQFRRKVALLLVAMLLLSITAVAADAGSYSGTWGELYWHLDVNSGRLTISGTGEMEEMMLIPPHTGQAWRGYTHLVSEIIVGPGITNIAYCAFAEMEQLKKVSLPAGLVRIDADAFASCSALKQIQIPASVTEIGPFAFAGCTALQEIVLPNAVESIGYRAFVDCTSLTGVTIPDHITKIEAGTFAGCSNLMEVNLPEGLSAIYDGAFERCALKRFQIPAGVTYIGNHTLSGCPLEEITVSGENENFVMHDQVLYTADQTELIVALPTLGGTYAVLDGVTVLHGGAFQNCTDLSVLLLPASVEALNVGDFYSCTSLRSIQVAEGCRKYRSDNGILISLEYESIMCCPQKFQGSYTVPQDVTRINSGAFRNCTGLTDIYIHGEIMSLGSYAFMGCTNLREVTIEENTSDWAEYAHLVLSGGLFGDCTSLTSLYIPASVKEIETRAFEGCVNLTSITVSEKSTTFSCDEAGNIYNKAQTELVCYLNRQGDTVYVPEGVVGLKFGAFQGCTWLKEIHLPEGLEFIGSCAFSGCSGLQELEVPASVETLYADAFSACDELRNIYVYPTECMILNNGFFGNEFTVVWGYENSSVQVYAQQIGQSFRVFGSKTPFVDVNSDRFFYEPVVWAVEQKITRGVDATHFAPNANCTRGQVVTFLWRAMGCPEPEGIMTDFVDLNRNRYYFKAVLWAAEQGITLGVDAKHFAPEKTVTRGEFVTFLWRAMGQPTSVAENPFHDVSDNRFYYQAVLWATETEVTNGVEEGRFAPEQNCTRGQVVTFLYRCFAK